MDKKNNLKSWVYLALILFIAFTVAGKIINIPHTSIGTTVLWGISYILIIIIGAVSAFKLLAESKRH